MPNKLFISYRSLDSAKVDALVARLRSLKNSDGSPRYDIWQDKTSIPVGHDWWKAIVQGIIDCDVFVYMLSSDSAQSINCRAELSYARRRNRPIIPLVLEGAFEFNPTTGKNDISYWEHIPQELNDGRFQFLFYEGTAFVSQIDAAVDRLVALRLPDLPAPEPPDPRDVDDASNDTALLYDQAVDYAGKLQFAPAEKLFQRLLNWNDPLFADDAREWIGLLRDYEQMVRLDARSTTRHKIPALWAAYAKRFPRPFVELFDPKGFKERYQEDTPPPKDDPSQAHRPSAPSVHKSSVELLPQPFAWIRIPAGRVTLVTETGWIANYIPEGQSQTFDVPAFSIAKYPVTNAQFRLFWAAKGYEQRRWWTDAGWAQREKDRWTQPRYWTDSTWNGDEQPVVGVSWYEAVAYCKWLSEVTEEAITLPTEQQWQRAAQGDDGCGYPWGPQWDASRCNNAVGGKGAGKTTPVRQYEGKDKGDSPFGVVDMAGNVWEWCLTAYETGSTSLDGTDVRVLRGGSWYGNHSDYFRCDFRGRNYPVNRNNNGGFRLALS
jgi:formylglycine-generating enzyme required for sulfatase activity